METTVVMPLPAFTCTVCTARVHELRRGRCWGCYARWVEARPVGLGARCATCNEKRRRFLKMVELFGAWRPLCFNCDGQLAQLDPVPLTLEALRFVVSRERRVGERRLGRDADPMVDDDMIIEITIDDSPDDGYEDLTQIRELVSALR